MYAKSAIILIIIAILIASTALTAFAAADNTINAGNPSGCKSDVCKQFETFKGDLLGFLRWLFPIGIATAGALSVIMLIFAGFQWMAGAISPPQIEAAKSRITAALSGLFLALISWLVLYTINPDLVTLREPGKLKLECPNGVCPKLEEALFGKTQNIELMKKYSEAQKNATEAQQGALNNPDCANIVKAREADIRKAEISFKACNNSLGEKAQLCIDRKNNLDRLNKNLNDFKNTDSRCVIK